MKFDYKKYSPEIIRPIIPVKIKYKDRSINYEVLVDSGADFCIFDAQIGEILGIDIESGEPRSVSGITGVSENYFIHTVNTEVGGWTYKTKVGFLLNIAQLGYGVVGQKGFFDKFLIIFNYQKQRVELKRKD